MTSPEQRTAVGAKPGSLGAALVVLTLALAGCQKSIPLPQVKSVSGAEPELIERGRYLAENVGVCMSCHTPRDFSYFSGLPLRERLGEGADVGMVFGYWPPRISMWAPNLTPTHLGDWSDAELQRAFVSGLGRDGHSLMLAMPYDQYNALSVDDARAIIAYLRALPPLPGTGPARKLPFPLEPFIVNLMPLEPHLVERAPPPEDKVGTGKYLAAIAGCLWCHSPMTKFDQVVKGKEWAGGHEFPRPTAGAELASLVRGPGIIRTPNISMDARTGIGTWTRELFIARFRDTNRGALEQLSKPGPKDMNTVMPWAAYAGMTEEDLGAIWDYLATFPPQDNVVNRFEPDAQK